MEVHHHGHKEGPKSWRSYLSEFFMLFLAVFSGFIAENVREHYVEKHRGEQYVESMLNDFKKDTAALQHAISKNQFHISGIDLLLAALTAPVSDSSNRKIYRYTGYVLSNETFESSKTTISQLKNAGGYRLITDTAIVNRIMRYDSDNEGIVGQAKVYSDNTEKIIDLVAEVMDLSNLDTVGKKSYFFESDAARKRLFYNKCWIQKKLIENYVGLLIRQQQNAIDNIRFLDTKH